MRNKKRSDVLQLRKRESSEQRQINFVLKRIGSGFRKQENNRRKSMLVMQKRLDNKSNLTLKKQKRP